MERYVATQFYKADSPESRILRESGIAPSEFVLAADAQATIAALQARVQELEQWVQDQSTANLETMRHTDEMQSRALEAEQQLTQHTSELEAANTLLYKKNCALGRAETSINDLQAELERVRGLVKTYADAKIDFDDKRLQEDHHAWRERYTRLVGAETILIALTATSQPAQEQCSYCKRPLTDNHSFSYGVPGVPRVYKCDRADCTKPATSQEGQHEAAN